MTIKKICTNCDGQGFTVFCWTKHFCNGCNGTGQIDFETININNMNNAEQGTVTIPLAEYNRLKLIEKGLSEKKSICLYNWSQTYLISEEDSNRVLFDKINQLTKSLEELKDYKHKMFMENHNKKNRLVFW